MSNVFSSVVWSRLMYEKVQRKFLENLIKICLKFDQIIFQGSNQVGWRGRVVVELELRLTIIRFTFGFVYIRIYMSLNITKFSCESFNGSQSGDLRVHNPSPSSRACLHTWFSYMFNEEIANKKMMKTSSLLHAHTILHLSRSWWGAEITTRSAGGSRTWCLASLLCAEILLRWWLWWWSGQERDV